MMRRRQQSSVGSATAFCLALIACGPPAPTAGGGGGEGSDLGAECLDLTGDGACDLELDPACLGGEHAASDPERQEACILMALANQDRQLFVEESAHAQELVWDERLWEVAKGHVEDMCARNYFEHETPEGLSPTDRANALGYDFSVAENVVVSGNSTSATSCGWRANLHRASRQHPQPFACRHRRDPLHGGALVGHAGRCAELPYEPCRPRAGLLHARRDRLRDAARPDPRAAACCTNCTPMGPRCCLSGAVRTTNAPAAPAPAPKRRRSPSETRAQTPRRARRRS